MSPIVPRTLSRPVQSFRRGPSNPLRSRDARAAGSVRARPPAARNHRGDIQGLRAVAVLLVAFSHAGVRFLRGGYVGVDVFFVLSGFLITQLLLASAGKPRLGALTDFYSRRARRILPAAALTLVVTDVVAYGLLNIVRAKQVLQDSIYASLFGANIHYAHEGTNYFAASQPPSPLQHFWSLSVEEQFYLVWPLVLLVVVGALSLRKRPTPGPAVRGRPPVSTAGRGRVCIAIALIGVASLAWSVHYTDENAAASYFSTFARGWELALGAALCLASNAVARIPPGPRAVLGWLGLAAIAVAAVTYSSSTPFPGYAASLPTVGAALVIGSGLGERQSRLAAGRILTLRPMGFVGDRSYAFYLWHWPVLIIAALYAGHNFSVAVNLLLLLGAFGLSIVSYGLFENPLRRMRWSSPRHALLLWPASILAVAIVAGWSIKQIDVKSTLLADAGAAQYPGYAPNFTQTGHDGATTATQTPVRLAPKTAGGPLSAVVAAAEAAQRHAPIPVGLTPPVSSLLNDHFNVPSGCEAPSGESTSRICTFGDASGSRSLVVLGDSHAQMWMPAIIPMASRDGWSVRLVTKSACTPADWYVPRFHVADCSAWYAWARREIESIHPTVTLIGGDFSTLGSQTPAAVAGLTSMLGTLEHYSKQVAVIGDDFLQPSQPVDCLLSSGANMSTCSAQPGASELEADSALAEAVPRAGGRYIDPTAWLCSQNRCPMVIGHTIVYSDTSHITATYAAQLSAVFRAAFKRAIGTHAGGQT